jgi:hypothetical protein
VLQAHGSAVGKATRVLKTGAAAECLFCGTRNREVIRRGGGARRGQLRETRDHECESTAAQF